MQVLGKAVLILPDNLPERTTSGSLIIPKTAKDKPETGIIVQVGPSCEEVKAGMKVHFGRKSASFIVIDDVEHYFTIEHKIFYYE